MGNPFIDALIFASLVSYLMVNVINSVILVADYCERESNHALKLLTLGEITFILLLATLYPVGVLFIRIGRSKFMSYKPFAKKKER